MLSTCSRGHALHSHMLVVTYTWLVSTIENAQLNCSDWGALLKLQWGLKAVHRCSWPKYWGSSEWVKGYILLPPSLNGLYAHNGHIGNIAIQVFCPMSNPYRVREYTFSMLFTGIAPDIWIDDWCRYWDIMHRFRSIVLISTVNNEWSWLVYL